MPAPIIILSFDRAQFLAPVLASLKAQRPRGVEGREVHLFQDGAVNRYSRLRYARDADISASVALFEAEFPEGIVHLSKDNIGVCENFKRAEQYVFAERELDCAWFFEDDLVLSPVYFQMMGQLQNFAENVGNVAYFAAYGNHYAPPEEVDARRRELMTLDHHWGFGLLRRHWQTLQPRLEEFYAAVVGSDYSRRDHRKIFEIYRKGSGAPRASSQDAAKALACDQVGLWRCNTVVPFARYIGASGQHMTPEKFKVLGYDNAVMAQSPVLDLDLPGLSGIRERVLEQRKLFESVRRDEFDGIMAELPVRKLNPARPCTRVDIEQAYHLFLRRRVESERLFERHAGRRSVQVLVSAVRMSLEFLDLTDDTAEVFTFKDALSRQLCSVADIQAIYALLFHREPDGDTVKQHAGKTPIDLLVEGILRSSEFRSLTERFPV